jgi:VWFA-related protein
MLGGEKLGRGGNVSCCMRTLQAFLVGLVVLGTGGVWAQDAGVAPKADLSVSAKLVVVPTVVRDKHGVLMNGLGKADFALAVDGKPQAIRYFDHDNDVPLTLGLLVDTSMSQRTVLADERAASARFLETMLVAARDKAYVIQFAHTVDLLQDVTDSKPKLQEALQQLDAESRPSFSQRGSGGSDNGGGRGMSGGGTALYDAVFLAADEVSAKVKGRRDLIVLTDGDDRGSKETLARSIEAAQKADTTVYAIYYQGQRPDSGGGPGGFGRHGGGGGFPGGGGRGGGGPFPLVNEFGQGRGGYGGGQREDGKKVLERMCGETGGRMFEVSKKLTVDAIYAAIGEELRAQYRLGFTPSAEAAGEGYHTVSVGLVGAATKSKPVVQARDGYYAGK